MARPSKYSKELADAICLKIIEGNSIKTICSSDDMPSIQTIYNWLNNSDLGFFELYARAKDIQADIMAEDIIDIADDGSNDYMTITKGDYEYNVEDREVTARSKLRVDARKWVASKLKPKKYGDKLDLTSGGDKIQGSQVVVNNPKTAKQLEDMGKKEDERD